MIMIKEQDINDIEALLATAMFDEYNGGPASQEAERLLKCIVKARRGYPQQKGEK